MRTFGTYFPIPLKHSLDDVVDVGKLWISGSEHYAFSLNDLNELKFNEEPLKKKGDLVGIHNFKGEGFEVGGLKYVTSIKNGNQWITELVCARDDEKQYVSVSVDNQVFSASHFSTDVRVPFLVKMFAKKMEGGRDGVLNMTTYPQDLRTDLIANIILGNSMSNLPVVYISSTKYGETAFNPLSLSNHIFGMAHVIVQKDKKQNEELRDLTGGRFPYSGAVGIYWPSGTYTKLLLEDADLPKIINRLISAKAKEKFPLQLQFSYLQSMISRSKIDDFQNKIEELKKNSNDSGDFEELAELYSAQADSYMKENISLEARMGDMSTEIQALRDHLSSSRSKGLSFSDHNVSEIYDGELNDAVISVLNRYLTSGTNELRKSFLIKKFVGDYTVSSKRDIIFEKLKNILTNMKKMNSSVIKTFEDQGFYIEPMKGGHFKLSHPSVPGISMQLPSTPSDNRSMKNVVSRFRKNFF